MNKAPRSRSVPRGFSCCIASLVRRWTIYVMEYYRHHYVPQFYLNGFTAADGLLHVTDKVRRKRWTASPAKTAWEPEFYRVDLENMDPMGIEKAFSQVEGQCAAVLRDMLATKKLPTGDAFDVMLNFVAISHTRVPLIRSTISEGIGGLMKSLGQLAFLGPEGAKRLREDSEIASMSDEEMEQLQTLIASSDNSVKPDQNWLVKIMLNSIDAILPALGQRHWGLWTVAEGVPDLVCSDRPVVLWSARRGLMPPGLGTPDTLLSFPLDRRTMLVSRLEEMPSDSYVMDAEDVEGMNLMRAVHATQIYASEEDWACAGGGSQAYLDTLIDPET